MTEAVTGVDIVQAQLRLAGGETLADARPRRERSRRRRTARPSRCGSTPRRCDPTARCCPRPAPSPSSTRRPGPACGSTRRPATGGAVNPRFDALVAKVVTWGDTLEAALQRAGRALGELRVEGVATNAGLLAALVAHPDVAAGRVTTRFVDEHLDRAPRRGHGRHPAGDVPRPATSPAPRRTGASAAGNAGLAGARLDSDDPLAVLHLGKAAAPARPPDRRRRPWPTVRSPWSLRSRAR